MTNYRRRFVPGGTFFFTVRLADLRQTFLVDHVDILRNAVRLCQKQRPFHINAAVILPSQAHMIWTLPPDDNDYSARWRQIKSTFSRHVPAPADLIRPSMRKRREKGIWQSGFWEHHIRDQEDYDRHDHLIVTAPLRAGLVRDGSDWPLCSAYHRKIRFNASPPLDIKTTARVPSSPDQATVGNAR